jgi:biotin-dependent carboxylase-like uncharacterized protein
VNSEVFRVLDPGLGATLQDQGRFGWRGFGVPASGAMDDHAAECANRLLDNQADAPVLELLLQGAKLVALSKAWIAITGADAEANVSTWRTVRVSSQEVLQFPRSHSGIWVYLAVEGGFQATRLLGSSSVYPRGGLGRAVAAGDVLRRTSGLAFHLLPGVASRAVSWKERRHYEAPPPLRVWPAPQWDYFCDVDRARFFAEEWVVTPQSDRVGYRLSGTALRPQRAEIISEPVRVGTIQVPANGQPLVTMRDGPTVGGYPKLGMIDPADLSWLAQCRPGQKVRFRLHQ